MTLTMDELKAIQDECMADDIEIDFEKMSIWTEDQARTFFETGEEPPPPFKPDVYLMGRLDKEELGHLGELLCVEKQQTMAGLVNLILTDRPKFLPTLKDLGVAKLPERQKIRDLINAVANPPKGSEDDLRNTFAEELKECPWCVVQSEKYIAEGDTDTMLHSIPEARKKHVKKYKIACRQKEMDGVTLRKGREIKSGAISQFPTLKNGEIVEADELSWAVHSPDLCLHVYYPNVLAPSMGLMQGWINFMDVLPLDENGETYKQPEVADFKMQRQIQDYFEDGYYQLSVHRAIKNAITDKPPTMTYRQACDLVYMQVRGPALIKLGFQPTTKGLNTYMDSRNPKDDWTGYDDADVITLMDAHNRIVALMSAGDPSKIPSAAAMRAKGENIDMGAAFEAEPEAEEEAEGEEGAPAAASADAPADAPAASDPPTEIS